MENKYYLDSSQQIAACHTHGPALIVAGPGSGKTSTLLSHISFLIQEHIANPSDLLVITYTKEAAQSMKIRYENTYGGTNQNITFCTFHSLFYQILLKETHLRKDSLITQKEKERLLLFLMQKNGLAAEFLPDLLRLFSMQKNGCDIEEGIKKCGFIKEQYQSIFKTYNEEVTRRGKVDFDDMLYLCKELFAKNEKVKERWQKRFSFIIVDEFQDTNPIQYELLKTLADRHKNLYVVGDDDQSVYGFRGANPTVMRDFEKDFDGVKVYYLNVNYRSTKEIVDAASRMISCNKNRIEKKIRAAKMQEDGAKNGHENDECKENSKVECIATNSIKDEYEKISKLVELCSKNSDYDSVAVIFRTHAEMSLLCAYLEEKNIPFESVGRKGEKQQFVQADIEAALRFISGKRERHDFLRLNQIWKLNIGREYLFDNPIDLEKVRKQLENDGENEKAELLYKIMKKLTIAQRLTPTMKIRFFMNSLGYDRFLLEFTKENEIHYQYLLRQAEQMQKMLLEFEKVEDYFAWKDEQSGQEESVKNLSNNRCEAQNENQGNDQCDNQSDRPAEIKLLTMHASKGLEFDCVIIPNLNDGMVPHGKKLEEQELEEERRIFYVAMTRAKKKLYLFYEAEAKEKIVKMSRFLTEIKEEA